MIPRLDAAPLRECIERRGGLLKVVQLHLDRLKVGRDEDDRPIGHLMPQYRRAQQAFYRARKDEEEAAKAGRPAKGLTVFWLDDFIVTYLQLHPCEVYGPAWFEAGIEQAAEVAA